MMDNQGMGEKIDGVELVSGDRWRVGSNGFFHWRDGKLIEAVITDAPESKDNGVYVASESGWTRPEPIS